MATFFFFATWIVFSLKVVISYPLSPVAVEALLTTRCRVKVEPVPSLEVTERLPFKLTAIYLQILSPRPLLSLFILLLILSSDLKNGWNKLT